MRSAGGPDVVHYHTEEVGRGREPRRLNDVMRGYLYACEWLEVDHEASRFLGPHEHVTVASRTRALWVPGGVDEGTGILFQWPVPQGAMQVGERDSFPPPEDVARVAFLEERRVPYPVIREARSYLENARHTQAKQEVMRLAVKRITDESKRHEGRLYRAANKAGFRP